MAALPLTESASVTLDGSGNGTLRLGPDNREHWQVAVASVSCETAVAEAQCKLYAGPSASAQYFVDGTRSGSTGDSTDRLSTFDFGKTTVPYVWAVWAGGDAGTSAWLNLSGTKT